MTVYVIKPKTLTGGGHAAFCNFHGGGAIFLDAKNETDMCCRLAIESDTIWFNVNYRKGPETRCPGGHNDAVAAIKYFHSNAEKYCIDPNRLSSFGCSGGGWIAAGSAIILSRD